MKRKVIIACVLTVFLLGGMLYSLPYMTIYRIIAAFEAKDNRQLSDIVDFPQIRENLKRFIGAKLQTETEGKKPDAWEQIQKSLASRIIAGAVEELITPEGLASFVRKRLEAMIAVQEGKNGGKLTAWPLFVALISHADLAYNSPSEFIVVFKGSDDGHIRFVLRRNGLAWRLTNIEF